MRPEPPRRDWSQTTLGRLALILAALSIMALLWHDYRLRQRAAAIERTTPTAVMAGGRHAQARDREDAADDALWDTDAEEGARWAADHPQAKETDCPHFDRAFDRACEAEALAREARR